MVQRPGRPRIKAKAPSRSKSQIIIPYSPRAQFVPFHNRSERFAIGVAHRRAGKTVACINDLIRGALTCEERNPRFVYLAPLYKQAKGALYH